MGMAFLISAEVGGGKTTSCLHLVEKARHLRFKVGGVVSPRCFDGSGKLVGYDCVDCLSGRRYPLARLPRAAAGEGWERYDSVGYLFSSKGLERANSAIRDAAGKRDLFAIFVDEVGKLELSGRGFAEGLLKLLAELRDGELVAVLSCRLEVVGWAEKLLRDRGIESLCWSPGDTEKLWGCVLEARERLTRSGG